MIEHQSITVKFICDRGVSHEIVRHRIASFAQESTRYCNYSQDKFGKEITIIEPYCFGKDSTEYSIWYNLCKQSEIAYNQLIEVGISPQMARSILPNSLKTEIVVTMNLREWRHFFKLRTENVAHPQMRQVAIPALLELRKCLPVVFDDIEYDKDFSPDKYANVIN
jgi:thymidylate synthase (FAD)